MDRKSLFPLRLLASLAANLSKRDSGLSGAWSYLALILANSDESLHPRISV
jgi:hypothetical protein